MRDFERDGRKYVCSSNTDFNGVMGFHVARHKWQNDKWSMESDTQFIPDIIRPTRNKVIAAFEVGTGYLYMKQRYDRRAKFHNSPEYEHLKESRKRLYENEQKFIEMMGSVGLHEAIEKAIEVGI